MLLAFFMFCGCSSQRSEASATVNKSAIELCAGLAGNASESKPVESSSDFRAFAGGIEENIGQFDGTAQFLASIRGASITLDQNSLTTLLVPPEEKLGDESRPRAVAMTFAGGKAEPCKGGDSLASTRAYYRGKNPKQWITRVPVYDSATCAAVYPGIDFRLRSGEALEYDFLVQPGANPSQIELAFEGGDSFTLNEQGDLIISSGTDQLVHSKPKAYQLVKGERLAVDVNFVLKERTIRFELGKYDPEQPLIIDPMVTLVTAALLAGGPFGHSHGNAIAFNATNGETLQAGQVYMLSSGTQFSREAYLAIYNDRGAVAFVGIFSGSGNTCTASYCNGDDVINGIAIASDGSVLLTGATTSNDFPIIGGFDQLCGTDGYCGRGSSLANPALKDAFVVKLDPALALINGFVIGAYAPTWGTYLGGGFTDEGTAVAVNRSGQVFVTGSTMSPSFPVRNAAQDHLAGQFDAFVVGLDPSVTDPAAQLLFSTYLGGSSSDFGRAMAMNSSDDGLAVVGMTLSTDFKATDPGNAPVLSPSSLGTAFVARYQTDGKFVDSTFLRGDGEDDARAAAYDASGSLYVAGSTTSKKFTGLQIANNGSSDAFVARLKFASPRSGPVSLDYATLFGGNNTDEVRGIAIDSHKRAYVTGNTRSANFPQVGALGSGFNTSFSGGTCGINHEICPDTFVARLSSIGKLEVSGLWGIRDWDEAKGIALRNDNDAIMTGDTYLLNPDHYHAFLTRAQFGTDIALQQSCAPSGVHAGQVLTCTVTATNQGAERATAVMAAIPIGERSYYNFYPPQFGECAPTVDASARVSRFSCNFGNIDAGQSVIRFYRLLPAVRGDRDYSVTHDYIDDYKPRNDSATTRVHVDATTDLSAFISHATDPAPLGSDVTYSIMIGNNGPDLAAGVGATIDIPAGLDVRSVNVGLGTCSPLTGSGPLTINCDIGFLTHTRAAIGGSIGSPITLVAHPNAAGRYTPNVRVFGDVVDTNPTNDSMSDPTNVIAGLVKLEARATVFKWTPTATGLELQIEVEVHNVGTGNAYDTKITSYAAVVPAGQPRAQILAVRRVDFGTVATGLGASTVFTVAIDPAVRNFDLLLDFTYSDAFTAGHAWQTRLPIVP
jgi:hypothetical protein